MPRTQALPASATDTAALEAQDPTVRSPERTSSASSQGGGLQGQDPSPQGGEDLGGEEGEVEQEGAAPVTGGHRTVTGGAAPISGGHLAHVDGAAPFRGGHRALGRGAAPDSGGHQTNDSREGLDILEEINAITERDVLGGDSIQLGSEGTDTVHPGQGSAPPPQVTMVPVAQAPADHQTRTGQLAALESNLGYRFGRPAAVTSALNVLNEVHALRTADYATMNEAELRQTVTTLSRELQAQRAIAAEGANRPAQCAINGSISPALVTGGVTGRVGMGVENRPPGITLGNTWRAGGSLTSVLPSSSRPAPQSNPRPMTAESARVANLTQSMLNTSAAAAANATSATNTLAAMKSQRDMAYAQQKHAEAQHRQAVQRADAAERANKEQQLQLDALTSAIQGLTAKLEAKSTKKVRKVATDEPEVQIVVDDDDLAGAQAKSKKAKKGTAVEASPPPVKAGWPEPSPLPIAAVCAFLRGGSLHNATWTVPVFAHLLAECDLYRGWPDHIKHVNAGTAHVLFRVCLHAAEQDVLKGLEEGERQRRVLVACAAMGRKQAKAKSGVAPTTESFWAIARLGLLAAVAATWDEVNSQTLDELATLGQLKSKCVEGMAENVGITGAMRDLDACKAAPNLHAFLPRPAMPRDQAELRPSLLVQEGGNRAQQNLSYGLGQAALHPGAPDQVTPTDGSPRHSTDQSPPRSSNTGQLHPIEQREITAFGSQIGRLYSAHRVTVSTSAEAREALRRFLDSLSVVHFHQTNWIEDPRVIESIKLNVFSQDLVRMAEHAAEHKKLDLSSVVKLLTWLDSVCTQRYQSEQAEAYALLQTLQMGLDNNFNNYVAQQERLFATARVEDPLHQITYFRNGLPIDVASELAVDPSTGQDFLTLAECQNRASALVSARRARRQVASAADDQRNVPRTQAGRRDNKYTKGKGKPKPKTYPKQTHPTLAAAQVEGDGRGTKRSGQEPDAALKKARLNKTVGCGNKALSERDVAAIIDEGRCWWCFQHMNDCKSGRAGDGKRCKMWGEQRPWRSKH